MPRVLSHSVDRRGSENGGNSKAEPATKGAISPPGGSIAYRVKRRNESDRMAQDATVDVRRSPSHIAGDSNLIRISS